MKRVLGSGVCCAAAFWLGVSAASGAVTYAYDGQGRLKTVITDDNKQTTYTLDDASNRTQVSATAGGINRPPRAHDRTLAVPNTGGSAGTVVIHPFTDSPVDTDPEGQAMTVVGVTQGQLGSVTFTSNSVTFTAANKRVTADDSFTYTIKDAGGLTDSAQITVQLQNVGPTAVNDSYGTIARNTPFLMDTPSPLANDHDADADPGEGLTIIAVGPTNPTGAGTLDFSYNTVTFTSAPGKTGTVTIPYTIRDLDGGTDSANISLTISSANTAPVANADGTAVLAGRYTDISVTDNDRDAEGDTITVDTTLVSSPSIGSATVNASTNVIHYTAPSSVDADTTVTFQYRIRDALNATSSSSVATVSVLVIKPQGGS